MRTDTTTKADVYEIVTARIIEQLEKGEIPWRNPYQHAGFPKNAISGKPYRGVNPWLLACSRYCHSNWLTFKQAQEAGGNVKKGEKASIVTFWKRYDKEEIDTATGEKDKRSAFVLRYYHVFNVAQCENLPAEMYDTLTEKPNNPIEEAERIVAGYKDKPVINEIDIARACYKPALDEIDIQHKRLFVDSNAFYSVLFHELTHSTGHSKRLHRQIDEYYEGSDGQGKYAKEELVAELGAGFLTATAGIENSHTIEDTTAYIGAWIKRLKNDKKLIVSASALAQKACDYILGTKFETETTQTQEA